ncbi:ligase-associated DNA damage response endonuclease PdeM [Pseudophaeobacter sp.]|uniref:ligase-associated DNA damage response endonuclease PdeM n=1 Tax=Pseudophaeobacter sp. TaxID=1971739 RepID=UPI0032983DCF
MNAHGGYGFSLAGATLTALPQGALWWQDQALLCVSDLHLGKSERHLRRGGAPLPPYEVEETLVRLEALLDSFAPQTVICLGDSFDDDLAATHLPPELKQRILDLTQARRWIWIEGNHDPAPTEFGGEHLPEFHLGTLVFRHIAQSQLQAQNEPQGEISGHYHPKAVLRGVSRPAFLLDQHRLILPAFGTYTGGLRSSDPVLSDLMQPKAIAILTGSQALAMPMPRQSRRG